MLNIKHSIQKTIYGEKKLIEKNTQLYPYCIVTAVYNVEKYLDAYFHSITEQSLGFEENIYILLVDDGSTDNSYKIIKKWQQQYVNNIGYIKKENAGQSSARNLGLKYTKAPWITFIDADDTVSNTYFKEVDSFVKKSSEIDIVSCNQVFYYESNARTKSHYLSYRFKNEVKVVNPSNMQGFIQTTVSSVFFQNKLLSKHKLQFQEGIQPIFFEDGHFINSLFIKEPTVNIAYLKEPVYYYTKREDQGSTIDTGWQQVTRYTDAIKYTILDLLKTENTLYIQRFALYQTFWYFKKLLDNPETVNFLTKDQLKAFQNLIEEIFHYIDAETIEVCALGGLWHKYRVGFYKLYKHNALFKQVCYIDEYNYKQKELKLHYYYHSNDKEIILLNKKEINASNTEVIKHEFLDDIFVYEKVLYIPLDGFWEYFDIRLCDIETQISLNKKRYKNGIQLSEFIATKML